MKKYTVYIYPAYLAYEVEAENEQDAEDIASYQYSYKGEGIYKIEAEEVDDDQ